MRLIVIALIASLISSTTYASSAEAASAAKEDQEAADWRKVADSVPLGSRVKVQRLDGHRVSGTLMRVDGHAVLIKRDTRRPELAMSIPFDDIARIERTKESGGVNVIKAIAIGAAAGAGAIVTMILFALQLD